MLAQQDVTTDEMYRHGYSFKNPGLIRYPLTAVGPNAIRVPYGPASVTKNKELYLREPICEREELGSWFSRAFRKSLRPVQKPFGISKWFMPTMQNTKRTFMSSRPVVGTPWLRRSAKARTNAMLGVVRPELQGFGEVPIGTSTVNTTPKSTTNFWGALSSVLTSGAGMFTQQQQIKLTQAQAELTAQASALERAKRAATAGISGNWPMILGLGGGALLVTMLIMKRRKR